MVFSRLDSAGEVRIMEGQDGDKSGAIDTNAVNAVEILTLEGKTLRVNVEQSTTVRAVKVECELLCGIPSDLQIIQLQGKELANDAYFTELNLPHVCTLKLTVPQWWLKFISNCFKGQTLHVRKRIFVKMNQVSREERTFTAAFIAAIKGNHNLMFAAFAGRKIDVLSRTRISGRTLLHAAISGGSTSCVANILMNGGSALLETPDNSGETPVQMAEKLYGADGEIVKFLNIYLELHQREMTGLGYNCDVTISGNEIENSQETGLGDENLLADFGELDKDDYPTNLDERSVEVTRKACYVSEKSISDSNFPFDTTANGSDAGDDDNLKISDTVYTFDDSSRRPKNGSHEFDHSRQGTRPTVITTDCSDYQNIAENKKHSSDMFNNGGLFAQTENTKQLDLGKQTEGEDVTNVSIVSAASADESEVSHSPKPRRRAVMRKLAFLEQRRKRSATERPNIRQLVIADSSDNQDEVSNEVQSDNKQGPLLTASDVLDVWQHQESTNVSMSSDREPEVTSSPKPLRRAHLRKLAFLERKRSATERPNLSRLVTNTATCSIDQTDQEPSDKEKKDKDDDLEVCQEQDVTNVSMKSVASGDECDLSHSPKSPRRAYLRKQAFLDQRRKKSTTERPNIEQLIIPDKHQEGNDVVTKNESEKEKPSDNAEDKAPHEGVHVQALSLDKETSSEDPSSHDSERPKSISPLPPATVNHNSLPVRRFRRFVQSSPTLEAKSTNEASSQGSWSSVSGDESDESNRQQNVVQETIARIHQSKINRRRRLPTVPPPHRKLNLPLIKIEDSTGSVTRVRGRHLFNSNHEPGHGQKTRERNTSIGDSNTSSFKAPHPPVQPYSRSRSGSTCSEDSVSSGEILSARSRAHSEGENVYYNKPVVTNLRPSKSCPVRQRRTSVPNSPFNPVSGSPRTEARRYSVQLDELDQQRYNMTPQLRARITLRGQPRNNMPWNEWRAVKRSAFNGGDSDEENPDVEDTEQKREASQEFNTAWKERPKSGRPSRMSFAEWLENKEALNRVRPESGRISFTDCSDQVTSNERQIQAAEKYQEWLQRKDQEALELEERLLREERRRSKVAHKKNWRLIGNRIVKKQIDGTD